MRVLITGAAGYVARRITESLSDSYDLHLGDVQRLDDARWVPLDVTDPVQAADAVRGMDAVIHLAIASGAEGEAEGDALNQRRFDVNVRGTWNVLTAAVRAGVKRFVHTSSVMVVWGYEPPDPVAGDAAARPVGTYAVTKHLAEELCRHVAAAHGLPIVCLRIAKPVDPDEWRGRRVRPQWFAFSDLVAAYRLALETPITGCQTATIVGASAPVRWDLSRAEELLGWRPHVRLEDHGCVLGEEREPF